METYVRLYLPVFLVFGLLAGLGIHLFAGADVVDVTLPRPSVKGKMSLEEALAARRSIRSFHTEALTPQQISQLLWAGQGITQARSGKRTSPSAGALYPLELYVCTAQGVDHYIPSGHTSRRVIEKDIRSELQAAALGQKCVGHAPAVFVITAVESRTSRKYGKRARRYVDMEVGHVGQNILLQAQSLKLGAVPVGAFDESQVAKLLSLPKGNGPLYIIPVGKPVK